MLHPFSPHGKGKMVSDASGLWYPRKDIDSLLAVLRRCVATALNKREHAEAIAAAREYLEEEKL